MEALEIMMRTLQNVFMALSVLCMAVPAFAQSAGSTSSSLVPLAAGIGMGIASGLCGIGQGLVAGPAAGALARNPGARAGILLFLILGLAFIESLALFTFVIILLKVK